VGIYIHAGAGTSQLLHASIITATYIERDSNLYHPIDLPDPQAQRKLRAHNGVACTVHSSATLLIGWPSFLKSRVRLHPLFMPPKAARIEKERRVELDFPPEVTTEVRG